MSETYSVYTRVGKSKPPLLVLLGDSYKSSTGGVAVAKKAMKQLMRQDPKLRKKRLYIRKHSTDTMKLYRASSRKIAPVTVKIGKTTITYTMKASAKYLSKQDNYRILQ